VGDVASGGSGPGTIAEQYVRIDRLELGAATLRDQHFYVLPFSYDTVERGTQPPLAGLLGLEIFERFAARIDYPNAKLTLRKPDSYRHQGAGIPVPITFDDDMPLLAGKIDGVPGPDGARYRERRLAGRATGVGAPARARGNAEARHPGNGFLRCRGRVAQLGEPRQLGQLGGATLRASDRPLCRGSSGRVFIAHRAAGSARRSFPISSSTSIISAA
jgi:hypothetical protein